MLTLLSALGRALRDLAHPRVLAVLVLIEGTDVSIFACGHLVWRALLAAEELKKHGVNAEVINVHTIKPLDADAASKHTMYYSGAAVTVPVVF